MIDGATVVVVVPAFEEEAHVGQVVATMPAFVDHVIVVDDGSSDATSARAREAARVGGPRVHVVKRANRSGVGAAIVTGYGEALALTSRDADVIAVMAGDGQMDPDDLARVVLPIARGEADYVKGDRFGAPGVRRTMGLPRWIGGQVFSRLTSHAIGQRISDSQCGFTALGRAAALRLDLDGLWRGFGYPNDLLGQLAARGFRIAEVAVRPVYGAENSKLRLRHLPAIFYLVFRAAMRRAGGVAGVRDRATAGPVTQTDDTREGELPPRPGVSSL